MATTKTSLVRVPTAFPPKRARGRKPASESNAAECRDRITTWKLTPENRRQPPMLTALAAELGISKQLASYYAKLAPESIEKFVDETERAALAERYPGLIKILFDLAQGGQVDAAKVIMREVVAPRRPEPHKQSVMMPDLYLQQAIAMHVHAPSDSTITIPADQSADRETKPVIIENEAAGQIK